MAEIESSPGFYEQWRKKLREQIIDKSVWLLLLIISGTAMWLWGWYSSGGISRAIGLPPGAIVAFSTPCDQLPGHWSFFEPAGGRFIIGAGNHSDNPGVTKAYAAFTTEGAPPPTGMERSTGGEEKHKLMLSEMPVHNHSNDPFQFLVRKTGRNTAKEVDDTANQIDTVSGSEIRPAGGDEPHNNIPPYVALYFCQK